MSEQLTDVLLFLVRWPAVRGVNLDEEVRTTLSANRQKYPEGDSTPKRYTARLAPRHARGGISCRTFKITHLDSFCARGLARTRACGEVRLERCTLWRRTS